MSDLPLFDEFPRLRRRLPWLPLGDWPSPVQRLGKFAAAHGLHELWIKREDLSRSPCGGNKIRGLEFLLAEARARRARRIITFGAAGSFHVRGTTLCAAECGIATTALLINQPQAAYVVRNLFTAAQAGAQLMPTHLPMLPIEFARQFALATLRHERPFIVPPGGTSPLACIGHVNAAFELRRQIDSGLLPEPEFIFVPLGSMGTAAGLAVGLRLAKIHARLVGVVVFHPWYCTSSAWAWLARRILDLMARRDRSFVAPKINPANLHVIRDAVGRGYAHFTPAAIDVARTLWESESILLDGTYTAKAAAGMLAFVQRHGLQQRRLLFWHTFSAGSANITLENPPARLGHILNAPPQSLDAALPKPQ